MKFKNINPNELKELMLGNSLLIDVRTPIEWFGSKIPGSVLVPLSDIKLEIILEICDKRIQKKILDENKEINLIFYCKSGVRSIKAINELFNKEDDMSDITKYNFVVYNLIHGIEGYKKDIV